MALMVLPLPLFPVVVMDAPLDDRVTPLEVVTMDEDAVGTMDADGAKEVPSVVLDIATKIPLPPSKLTSVLSPVITVSFAHQSLDRFIVQTAVTQHCILWGCLVMPT